MNKFLLTLVSVSYCFGTIASVIVTVFAAIAVSVCYSPWLGVPLLLLIPIWWAIGTTLADKALDSEYKQ